MSTKNTNLLGRYVWLIDTIRQHERITFSEINTLWQRCGLSHGEPLPLRTFRNHLDKIQDIFDIVIECDRNDGYKYYILDAECIDKSKIRSWLISSYATLNQLQADRTLEHRIQFEEIPSGQRYLTTILQAMHRNAVVELTYQGFGKSDPSQLKAEPYAVKVHQRRWYVVARVVAYDEIRIFALDRMHSLALTEECFQFPSDFQLDNYFEGCVGIIRSEEQPIERVVVRAYSHARNYIATLPLHKSQTELEADDESTTFVYHVRPNFEFVQLLLMQVGMVEVLEPKWLRNEMKQTTTSILARYTE